MLGPQTCVGSHTQPDCMYSDEFFTRPGFWMFAQPLHCACAVPRVRAMLSIVFPPGEKVMKSSSFSQKAVLQVGLASLIFLIGLTALPSARADNLYARILGTVTDSTGAVLPGVTVIAFNTGTGLSRRDLRCHGKLRIHPASHRK